MIYMQYFTSHSLEERLLAPLFSQRNWALGQLHRFPCFTVGNVWGWYLHQGCLSQLHDFVRQYASLGKVLILELSWELKPCFHWVKQCSFSLILPPNSPHALLLLSLSPNTWSKQRFVFALVKEYSLLWERRQSSLARWGGAVQGTETCNGA